MSSMDNSQDDAQNSSSQQNTPNNTHSIKGAKLSEKQLSQKKLSQKQLSQKQQSSNQKLEIQQNLSQQLHNQQSQSKSQSMNQEDNAIQDFQKALLTSQVTNAGIMHPNIQPNMKALDPDRPLTDIPEPAPRYHQSLQSILSSQAAIEFPSSQPQDQSLETASMWDLIASPEMASHLELLQLGGLINLPSRFFEPVSVVDSKDNFKLLAPLTQMTLLDISDIQQVCHKYPNLTRYGFKDKTNSKTGFNKKTGKKDGGLKQPSTAEFGNGVYQSQSHKTNDGGQSAISELARVMPEMINDIFAPNWELVLYPERFDNGVDSLTTDILACSVAVHILKQCPRRQSINRRMTVQKICQYMRSFVLSQFNSHPQFEKQYRQIRLFAGHVIVAAEYLGFDIVHATQHSISSTTNSKGKTSENLGQPVYINVSSRSALFCRYPNISSYYVNGWS